MNTVKPLLGIAGFLLALAFIPLRNAMMSPPDDYWFQARVVDQDEPVLVKFGADWCPPCVAMDPELARLKSRYSGKLHVVKINVDEKPHLAKHYGVSGIPRVFLFDHGRVKRSRTGYASQEELSDWVSPYL